MERIAELQQLIADFAKVKRFPHLADIPRRENDAEHSYGLAMTAWFLSGHIAPELDVGKVLRYALAHDLVELYAGDTHVFAPAKVKATKDARELKALAQLKKEWPDFKDMARYIEGYKNKAEEEAIFVYAVDKILPTIMINLGEKEKYWHRYKVTADMLADEKRDKLRLSQHMAPYFERFMAWAKDPDYFYKPGD